MGEKRLCLSDLAQVNHRYVCLYIYIPISIFSMKVFACGVWNPGFGFRNSAQGMASSTDKESRISTGNPESIACLTEYRVQDWNLELLY